MRTRFPFLQLHIYINKIASSVYFFELELVAYCPKIALSYYSYLIAQRLCLLHQVSG